MSKIVKIIIILICVLDVLLLLFIFQNFRFQSNRGFSIQSEQKLQTGTACFNQNCFTVEVAKTSLQRQRGLMLRTHLDADKGMLFVFEKEGDYPFWMKGTLIPLDMIWINENNEVVFIKENALPCQDNNCPTIDPSQKAKYVLEINGGAAKNIPLTLGDKITFGQLSY